MRGKRSRLEIIIANSGVSLSIPSIDIRPQIEAFDGGAVIYIDPYLYTCFKSFDTSVLTEYEAELKDIQARVSHNSQFSTHPKQ